MFAQNFNSISMQTKYTHKHPHIHKRFKTWKMWKNSLENFHCFLTNNEAEDDVRNGAGSRSHHE